MKLSIFVLLVLSPLLSYSFQELNLEYYDLKGSVLSISQRIYFAESTDGKVVPGEMIFDYYQNYDVKFNFKGKVISEQYYDPEGKIISESKSNYDDYGLLKSAEMFDGEQRTKYYNEHNFMDWPTYQRSYIDDVYNGMLKFSYDIKGRVIGNESYDKDGNLERKSILRYNDEGQLIENTTTNSEGSTSGLVNTYNDEGLLVKSLRNDNKGKVYVTVNTYNDQGWLIKEQDLEDNEPGDYISYKYDSEGNVIEEVNYNEFNELMDKYVYEIDEHGNITIEKYYEEGKLSDETRWSYTFDSQGNWIEVIEYYEGEADSITKRHIKYY